jgi:hypothetical protein
MRGKYIQIWDAIKSADILIFFIGLGAFVLALTIASLRLKLIVDAKGTANITLAQAISLTFIGYFFNNFLPTSIGGDVAKAYYLSRKSSEKLSAFTAVFVDRALGLITMIFMASIALLLVQNQIIDDNVRYAVYAITAFSVIGIFFLMNKRFAKHFAMLFSLIRPFEEKLKRVYNAIHAYRNHTSLMIKSFAISVVSQILFFVSIGILAVSIGAPISPMEILLRMPIVCAASLLPSINGLGVREGAMVLFFGPLIGKTSAFAVSILWLLMLFIVSIVGGLIYAFSPQFKIKWGEVKEEDVL